MVVPVVGRNRRRYLARSFDEKIEKEKVFDDCVVRVV